MVPACPRRPTEFDAASDRLRAAVGAALGLRDPPTLKGACPALKFLIAIDDETANADEREAFERMAPSVHFPGRSFTTRIYLLALARAGRSA